MPHSMSPVVIYNIITVIPRINEKNFDLTELAVPRFIIQVKDMRCEIWDVRCGIVKIHIPS